MLASLRLTRNTISPSLQRRARALKDRRPLLRTMGEYTVQHTKRAFNEPALRPSPWPALYSGKPSRLRKNNVLHRSPRLISVDNGKALVGSDRPYAAIHQLGGQTRAHVIRAKNGKALAWPGIKHPVKQVNHPGSKIPARPYFPFRKNGRPTAAFKTRLNKVVKTKLDQMLK